jgi:hypothetical protein
MDVNTQCTMIMDHPPVLRQLSRTILALPTELLVGEKMIGVLVIGVHVIFPERHKQKHMWLTDDEPDVPGALIE